MDDNVLKIKECINNYIDNKDCEFAILVDGDWGSGKTYFIKNEFIKKRDNILYISLYGIKDTDEIDSKIYYELLWKTKKGHNSKHKKLLNNINCIAKPIAKIASQVIKIKISRKDLSGIISLFSDISKFVIVFDDLERCEMSINETLGYINNLVEHKHVKSIIVANEKEIEKVNYNNYELKILTCLDKNVDYNDIQDKNGFSNTNYQNDKIVSLDILRKRVNTLYDYNNKYKIIKEKLIGQSIIYKPDLNELYLIFINKFKETNNNIYNILFSSKDKFLKIMYDNNCYNLRTMQFIIEKFKKIYLKSFEIINSNYKDKYWIYVKFLDTFFRTT